MKLRKYLENALGSKTSIRILRTLIWRRGKVFTIRKLAEEAGVSHPMSAQAAYELERLGIVQIQPIGRSYQVSLNEKSYILKKIIAPMFIAEERLFDQVVATLKKHLDTKKVIAAAIFGSVAGGQEREGSDIDVLIISNSYEHAITAVSDAGEESFARFHSNVSPLVFSEAEFKSKKDGDLVRSILDNHIAICGKRLEQVLKGQGGQSPKKRQDTSQNPENFCRLPGSQRKTQSTAAR